jgi:hypothetical protein
MPADPNSNLSPLARKSLRLTALLFVVAVCYSGGFVFYRWQENREYENQVREKEDAKKAADDRRAVEFLGGNRFEILSFYGSPGIIRRGDSAQLCYGVSNAKSVRLDPPAGSVWPSASRCVSVAPTKDTTYTLTATDAAGNTTSRSLTIKVR